MIGKQSCAAADRNGNSGSTGETRQARPLVRDFMGQRQFLQAHKDQSMEGVTRRL